MAFLALLLAICSAARPVGFEGADEERNIKELVHRAKWQAAAGDPAKYKATEPIIGILTQPCTDCPGRCGIGVGRRAGRALVGVHRL